MTDNTSKDYTLSADEKSGSIIVYLDQAIIIGEVVLKESIRFISTWLRTNAAPESVYLRKAKMIYIAVDSKPKSMTFDEMFVTTTDILAYHIMPPATEPLDFDAEEPNRRMVPISALLGKFRIDGKTRMSQQVDLKKALEISREEFKSIYDASIYCPVMPALGIVTVPMVLVRQAKTIFAE
ncbi:MAG: hypothetical protein JEZ00_00255 [Anaerolineaceae bacterium]|nr:hypothetical protein [Anaerolineaceae bacterium]